MQKRHQDRELYFTELANTSREFYLDHVRLEKPLSPATRVLEVGCGEGGNLLPFAEAGCSVTGIDIDAPRVENARRFFEKNGREGTFVASDFMAVEPPADEAAMFDVVLVHDVIEHIEPPHKERFLSHVKRFMRPDAVAFIAFPAWQMPFGGHQQICRGKLSKLPFLHLLPAPLYRAVLIACKEPRGVVDELLSIKRARMPIGKFERLAAGEGLRVVRRNLWLINPHYKQKFGLRPRRLVCPFDRIPWLRNFYATSAWYLLSK